MGGIFYSLFILIFSVFLALASQDTEKTKTTTFADFFHELLTTTHQPPPRQHPQLSIDFVSNVENLTITQETLKHKKMTPYDLCDTLTDSFLFPKLASLVKDSYKEQRASSEALEEFDQSDSQFYSKLHHVYKLDKNTNWKHLEGRSKKEEVMCEASYFYNLIDFERALECLDAAPFALLDCKVFSNFVADMYLGEAGRPDYSYNDDEEGRKWLKEMVDKYEGNSPAYTSSLMRRFTGNISGKVDYKLWTNYMRAMMTVHLSASLIRCNIDALKDMYDYLTENNIHEEFMFASLEKDPLEPGQEKQDSHAFLRTFKLDPSGETATMGIINSGYGINPHDHVKFKVSELPDTIASQWYLTEVNRYIPFIVYDAVPKSDWAPAYTTTDSMEKAYFENKYPRHVFDDYQQWHYLDSQRAGTCSAMSLWYGLYWFERGSQQKVESFRLALYLEILKEAAEGLAKLRTEMEELDYQRLEATNDEPKWEALNSTIKKKNELEDDFLRFFSVAFNSAILSIRYLHSDPFKQGLDMTTTMRDYVKFYNSQTSQKYWQFVKPSIDDLYSSTFNLILKPTAPLTRTIKPETFFRERDCIDYVNLATKSKDPFEFVKAVISGIRSKCHSKAFFDSITREVDTFNPLAHHQELILRALLREHSESRGRKMVIRRFIEKLIIDHHFELFPTYNLPATQNDDFSLDIDRVFELESDLEVQQFVVNLVDIASLATQLYHLFYWPTRVVEETDGKNLGSSEEYKMHTRFVSHVSAELQAMNPHRYAQHLNKLIRNVPIDKYIYLFEPSAEWDSGDLASLEKAAQGNRLSKTFIRQYIDHFDDLKEGQKLASEHALIPTTGDVTGEYICTSVVNSAIKAKSPLDFVKAVASGVENKCHSELFFTFVTLGVETLKLQEYHQNLILFALMKHDNLLPAFTFIDKLITTFGFKLFPTDHTLPDLSSSISNFFSEVRLLRDDAEARQFVANYSDQDSPLVVRLLEYTGRKELKELKPHLLSHVFTELQAMDPHLYAYHLSRLLAHGSLGLDDFTSPAFKKSEEWDEYDYAMIDCKISRHYRLALEKIFSFPKEYHIDTEGARKPEEFELMAANPSEETLKEYATMLLATKK